jgi:two-component system OmpR family sensor kinase
VRRWLGRRTLSTRLVAGVLVVFALSCVGVYLVTTASLRSFLINRLDGQLADNQQLALSLESQSHGSAQPGFGSGTPFGGPGPGSPGQPALGTVFGAWILDGRLMSAAIERSGRAATSLDLPAADRTVLLALPRTGAPVTRELPGLGLYRLIAVRGVNDDVHVTGLPLADVTGTLHRLVIVELVVFGVSLLVAGVGCFGWVRLSLRPLARITATASEVAALTLDRGEVDLAHRVPEGDPATEVGRLGSAFNHMLGEVERALSSRHASEAQLRQFIADASHELRTPLAGIRSYAELGLRNHDEAELALRRVDSESRRMSRLVDDLLLLARLDAGRPLARDPVDLSRLAMEVTDDARVAGPEHRWVLDLPEQPVIVPGDVHRLHQVLANLLTNARTHTPPGTTVTVRLSEVSAVGRMAELSVVDDGPGIPPAIVGSVFERFVRADGARSRAAGGTGLGLAIVHGVVTAHGGAVRVVSEPGRTSFDVALPAQ